MRVQSFADLMNGHKSAEILNLLNNEVVRRLIVVGDNVEIDALSIKIKVPLNTTISYEPWMMDRGNMLFECKEIKGGAKICTELDIIQFPDGTSESITPD